ncbi:Pentatricopeptide repeat-containing protein [Dendrobium catenatum]|uniref:Pentatricopeptide repeat-containing protein n=1 Tax=Dendrobium catenatum TaxID=906689 RepID=A0A2I0W8Z0_9ASPA|nr:Pentatricopeptide repeat-containing protein [Dendrobium catenatum]
MVEWFEKMPEFGYSPYDVPHSVNAYGHLGNVDMARALYHELKGKWNLDLATFVTMFGVYGASGHFNGALNVFEEMKERDVKPKSFTHNKMLEAIGRCGRPWQVKNIYKEMVGKRIVPNMITYYLLLKAYSQSWYVVDANVVLYNILLFIYADVGYIDEAVEIFEEMKELHDYNFEPDAYSSDIVMKALCVFDQIIEYGSETHIITYNVLLDGYLKAGQIDVATYAEMSLNFYTFNIFVSKCRKSRKDQKGLVQNLFRYSSTNKLANIYRGHKVFDPGGLIIISTSIFLPMESLDGVKLF